MPFRSFDYGNWSKSGVTELAKKGKYFKMDSKDWRTI